MYKYILFSALSAFALSAQTADTETVRTTGMVGIGSNQTAQLNLLNPGVLPPAMGEICTAAVSFVDDAGTTLKTGTLAVPPGHSLAFTLNSASDISVVAPARREIRATITIPAIVPVSSASSTSPTPSCKVIPTLELFDNGTGRTLVILGHAHEVPSVVTPTTSN